MGNGPLGAVSCHHDHVAPGDEKRDASPRSSPLDIGKQEEGVSSSQETKSTTWIQIKNAEGRIATETEKLAKARDLFTMTFDVNVKTGSADALTHSADTEAAAGQPDHSSVIFDSAAPLGIGIIEKGGHSKVSSVEADSKAAHVPVGTERECHLPPSGPHLTPTRVRRRVALLTRLRFSHLARQSSRSTARA